MSDWYEHADAELDSLRRQADEAYNRLLAELREALDEPEPWNGIPRRGNRDESQNETD